MTQEPSLQSRAKRGSFWSLFGYGGTQVIRLAGNLILTRMLFEEAFGLMSLVAVFLSGLELFSDIGIGPSIIQNRRGDESTFLNTAWTMQVGRGVLLWLVACVGAAPFAAAYDPQLALILPISGTTAVISGFNSTKLFSLNRHLAMRKLAWVQIWTQVAGLVAMVLWALVDRSVWALVAGGVANCIAHMVLSHLALPGAGNRFMWHRESATELIQFGRWIFFSTVLTFFVGQSDRLIFGAMIPLDLLGVYHIAATLAAIPNLALSHMSSSIIFPLYSRVLEDGGDIQGTYEKARFPLLVLGGWMMGGLVAGGPAAVGVLYDVRYAEAGWIAQMLAAGGWFAILGGPNRSVLLAHGQPRWLALANTIKLIGIVALIPLGYQTAGFFGAVAGFAASEILHYAVAAGGVASLGVKGWVIDLGMTGWLLVSAGLGWWAARAVEPLASTPWVPALTVLAVVTLAWLPGGWKYLARSPQRS